MAESEERLHQLGSFDLPEAKRVISALEAEDIPFGVDTDNSELARPTRTIELALGMYPEGSKVAVFIPESQLSKALDLLVEIFPV